MIKNNKSFYSKILLAGEYTVMTDGFALAIPFRKYSGKFILNQEKVQLELRDLYYYLIENNLDTYFDLKQMLVDIESGLYYKADIPVGYGLGSSGALIAALYECYGYEDYSDFNQLKLILSKAECAFHGTSSGMDPIVSYVNQPVLFTREGIKLISDEILHLNDFFLIDTGIPRSTSHYVQIYKQKYENLVGFKSQVKTLESLNAMLIDSILGNQLKELKTIIKKVSLLQFELFKEMIPDDFLEIWSHGLKTDDFYLKLCGAGGGGMILGWSENPTFDCKYPIIKL